MHLLLVARTRAVLLIVAPAQLDRLALERVEGRRGVSQRPRPATPRRGRSHLLPRGVRARALLPLAARQLTAPRADQQALSPVGV